MAMAKEDSQVGAVISGELIGNLRFTNDMTLLSWEKKWNYNQKNSIK